MSSSPTTEALVDEIKIYERVGYMPAGARKLMSVVSQRLSDLEGKLGEASKTRDEAIRLMCETSAKLGEMEGRYKAAHWPGIVDGWKERAFAAESKLGEARKALERIERWFGEFPATNRTWDDGSPMSYAACYGSNGERDFMRDIASEALKLTASGGEEGSSSASSERAARRPSDVCDQQLSTSLEALEALAAEFAKPQFMTTTNGPGAAPGTRKYSLEFTFIDSVGGEFEGEARQRRDDLHEAIRVAAHAVRS